ncbi:hypothetical protein ABIF97_008426 [Bradyrhizobium japonicum]
MLSTNDRIVLGTLIVLILWLFLFLPVYHESFEGIVVVWDFVSAVICAGIVLLLLPSLWARIHGLFEVFSDLAAPIFVLILASVIYSTAQMREVLWIKFAPGIDPNDPLAPFSLMAGVFGTDLWATSSMLLLVIALGVWGPAHFYPYSDVVSAFRLYPHAHRIADRLLEVMSQANRFGFAWLLAPLLPVVIFYNALVPTFPLKGELFYVGWEILFYGLLLASIFGLVFLYTLLVYLTSRDRWRIDFVVRAFPYLPLIPFVTLFKNFPRLSESFLSIKLNRQLFEAALFSLFVLAIFAFVLFCIVPIVYLASGLNIMSVVQNEIFTVNVFLAASLSFSATLFGLAREKKRWHGLHVIIGAMLAFAYFDLDDNHAIRRLAGQSTAGTYVKPLTLEDGFQTWIASRSDLDRFEDGTYPVYVVAAEGGGIYAAYHAGMFLAAIQDQYPEFAQHTFAISAVSGGALGASIFSSLVKARTRVDAARAPQNWYWDNAQSFLQKDFLSDLISATLFLDAPARILPCWNLLCPGASLNRARALERSIENAWPAAAQDRKYPNPFKSGILGSWDPKSVAPALLLNSTEVETGERVVVAPMSLQSSQTPGLYSLSDRNPTLDIPLSTGVGLSASFPFVSPAGWYAATAPTGERIRTEKRRLVDGGYSDNSGIATALDIIARLQACPATRPVDCKPKARFILLALVSPPADDGFDNSTYSFGELATPLRALDSIRSERGRRAVAQAQLFMDQKTCADADQENHSASCTEGRVRKVILATDDVRVPLGWVLSDRSRRAIECSFGLEAHCPAAPIGKNTASMRENNKRIALQIGKELKTDRMSESSPPTNDAAHLGTGAISPPR